MIKMVATRRYYRAEDGREYAPGQQFSVATDREAARLITRRRAMRAAEASAELEPPAELELETPGDAPAPRRRGRYARRDVRAED